MSECAVSWPVGPLCGHLFGWACPCTLQRPYTAPCTACSVRHTQRRPRCTHAQQSRHKPHRPWSSPPALARLCKNPHAREQLHPPPQHHLSSHDRTHTKTGHTHTCSSALASSSRCACALFCSLSVRTSSLIRDSSPSSRSTCKFTSQKCGTYLGIQFSAHLAHRCCVPSVSKLQMACPRFAVAASVRVCTVQHACVGQACVP